MNKLQEPLFNAPSIKSEYCVFCGRKAQSQHHVVPRSQGGTKGATLSVCGFGNESGCHGLLHAHKLHVKYEDGWHYLFTKEPMKYQNALDLNGWKPLWK